MSQPNDLQLDGGPLLPAEEIKQQKSHELIEKFEGFAMQNSSKGLDFSKLSPEQVDRLIGIMEKNEENAFKFHSKRLDTVEKIELANIKSYSSGQRTLRLIFVGSVVIVAAITFVILIYKERYFIPWVTFIGGILSGMGLSRVPELFTNNKKTPNAKTKETKNDELED